MSRLVPTPPPPPWDEYRRRWRVAWVVLLTYLPAVVVLGVPMKWVTASDLPVALLASAWMTGILLAGWRAGVFPCPRCGRPFFLRGMIGKLLARECVHCGLPKYAPADFPYTADDYS